MGRQKKAKVFVSYSRHDEALVRPLAGLLGVAANDAVFLDVTALKPGDLWDEKIIAAVKEASVFVLCWCCESEHSTFVAKEISAALAEGNKKLVPVLFCSTPLPPTMADRQWIDLRGQVMHQCPSDHQRKAKQKAPQPGQRKIDRVRPLPTIDELGHGYDDEETGEGAPSQSYPAATAAAPAPMERKAGSPITLVLAAVIAGLVAIGIPLFFQRHTVPVSTVPGQLGEAPHSSGLSNHLPSRLFVVLLTVILVGIVVAILRTRKKGPMAPSPMQTDSREAEEIAAKAKSYFEGLAGEGPPQHPTAKDQE